MKLIHVACSISITPVIMIFMINKIEISNTKLTFEEMYYFWPPKFQSNHISTLIHMGLNGMLSD